tara:strand:- start:77 stop:379 length:303 start_codon:yes stop_codon:yes gene_type:complete
MPLELSEFPEEVQEAFFVFSLLSEHWDGASGSYMGKIWTEIDYILNLYEIEDKKTVYFFTKKLEIKMVNIRAKEADRKRKAEERKAKAGSNKNYTHNVRG